MLGKEGLGTGNQVPLRSQETCPGYIALSAENRNHAPGPGTISPFNFHPLLQPRAKE
jgi:hypothetical protein